MSQLERVTAVATRLRAAIERAQQADAEIEWLSRFPKKCCNFTSNLLVCELHELGIAPVRRLIGVVDEEQDLRHVWVEADGITVDITADCHGQPAVVVAEDSPWHADLEDVGPFLPRADLETGLVEDQIERLKTLYQDARQTLTAFFDGTP